MIFLILKIISGWGVRRKSGLDLSAILEPLDNVSSNTVVGQGMELNNLVGSNSPRQLSSPNPGTTFRAPSCSYRRLS